MRSAERVRRASFTALLCIIGIGFNPMFSARPQAQARSRGWRVEAAAKYLDERMNLWFEKAKKLRTGSEKTACVSCHTTIPYMLARPALRRAMKISVPTAQEARIIDEAARRIENPDAHQPLYDHTESRKMESRGTEAVLNALILASADAAQARRERSQATERAFARLWETQRPDGAWDWLEFGLEPFETVEGAYFGATLAAMAVGTAPASSRDRAGLKKLRGYLTAKYNTQSLFNRTWLLLASARLPLLGKRERTDLIRALQRRQREDGGWSLDSLGPWHWSRTAEPYRAPGTPDAALLAQSDGLATGLIVYAFRQSGLPVTHPSVGRGLEWLRAQQQDGQPGEQAWPAWRAHSLNFDREHGGEKGEPWRRMFMSDLATAFAALALLNAGAVPHA